VYLQLEEINRRPAPYFGVDTLTAELEGRGFVVEEILGDVAGAGLDPAAHEFAAVARRPVQG
jgi:hypothetical protein